MRIAGFGEIMLRLATNKGFMVSNTNNYNANYGGGEANVLISLSKFGLDTKMITKVSNNDLGEGVISYLNSHRIDTKHVLWGDERTGIYFLEVGGGNRASKVIYDRSDSAFSNMKVTDLDIEQALYDVDLFHFSGITLALSKEIRKLTMDILKYCKSNNIMVSYDSNYRAKMWTLEEARQATLDILPFVNILSAGILDAENILKMNCEYECKYEKLNYYYNKINSDYPNIKHMFSSIRTLQSVSVNTLQCNYYTDYKLYTSKEYVIDDIVDRVGGGDALTAGILYSILNNKEADYVAEFATASSVLKHSIYGDANLVNVEDVESLMKNGVGKIDR